MTNVTINNLKPRVTEVCNYNLTRKEGGNTGFLRIWHDVEIQPYDKVEITQDDVYEFVVGKVKTVQKSSDYIIYEVNLIDAYHIFDSIFPPSRRFTTFGGKTIAEILDVYARTYQNELLFEYQYNVLLDTKMPKKEYDGVNFSTILTDLFKRVNSIPRVELRDDDVPYIRLEQMDKKVGTTAIDYDPNHLQTEYDSTNYATEVLGKVKNAVMEDGRYTWFPSKVGGVTPRTEEFRFDEATASYLFNDKIWLMLEVTVVDGIRYKLEGTELEWTYEDIPLAILVNNELEYLVVSKNEWDYLPNPNTPNDVDDTAKNQSNTVYYTIGGDKVTKLWATHAGFGDREHLMNAYNSAYIRYNNDPQYAIIEKTHVIMRDVILRFKYISQRDIDYIVEKLSIKNKYRSTLLSNQLSTLVEINRHSDGAGSLAERLANKEIQFKEKNTDGNLYKLGNWTTDDRIITELRREIKSDTTTMQTCILNKNFANIDVTSQISREPYPFQITDKTIQTNIITKEYIEFSEIQRDIDSYMGAVARRVAVNLFNYDSQYNRPIYDCHLKPNIPDFIIGDNVGKDIHAPLFVFGGRSIVFQQQFRNNLIAGYSLIVDGSDYKRGIITYKQETKGVIQELDTYDIKFGTETPTIDTSGVSRLYPLVIERNGLIEINGVNIDLDPNSAQAHTHHVCNVSDSENIVLNENFGYYNNLVFELETPTLEVWVSQALWDTYSSNDKTPRLNDIYYGAGVVTFNTTSRLLSVTHPNTTDNIAIVHNGKIIIAFNGIDSCYINFLKQRTSIIKPSIPAFDELLTRNVNIVRLPSYSIQLNYTHQTARNITISKYVDYGIVEEVAESVNIARNINLQRALSYDIVELQSEEHQTARNVSISRIADIDVCWTECSFDVVNSYLSSTDQTTDPVPMCGNGVQKIVCTYDTNLKQWVCTEYEGVVTTTCATQV